MVKLRARSLRRRLAIWMGTAVALTVAGLTAVSVAAEHELVRARLHQLLQIMPADRELRTAV